MCHFFYLSDQTNTLKRNHNESGNESSIEHNTNTKNRNNDLSQTNTHIPMKDPLSFIPTCCPNRQENFSPKRCSLSQPCPENINYRQNVSSIVQQPIRRVYISPSDDCFTPESLYNIGKKDVVIIKRSLPEGSDSDCKPGNVYENEHEKAKNQNILWRDFPYTRDQIGRMPVSKFNDLILQLDEMRVHVARDIRRKFKNKIAARNCRKRKIQQIDHLDTGLESLESNLHKLQTENKDLKKDIADLTNKLSWFDQQIFDKLKDRDAIPSFSEKTHSLWYANDKVFLVSQPPKKTVTITVQ
uniref:BZIP domain-containing protein n=1 Tax=Clytia hemisphaerica TaxID=252671 RepID=A0A7M5UYP7_9CNID